MSCIICDTDTEEVEVECKETRTRVKIAICDECLLNAETDSFALTNLVQAKIDIALGH